MVLKLERIFIRGEGKSFRQGKKAAEALLNCIPGPTAIIAEDDILAIGALRGAYDMDLKVPDDVSIIGFDDNLIDSFLVPRLTTIHYPIIKMARAAVEILLERIENKSIKSIEEIIIAPRLIIRESTSKPNNLK